MGLPNQKKVWSQKNYVVPTHQTAPCGVSGMLLCAHPWQELLPLSRRDFRTTKVLLCAPMQGCLNRRKGLASRASSCRNAKLPHPDPAMTENNLSNRACTQCCLWSERGVVELARSCTAQKGNRISKVLRCVHTSLPQWRRSGLGGV